MNYQVKAYHTPRRWGQTDQLGVAEDGGCAMVEAVEERWHQKKSEEYPHEQRSIVELTQWLLLQEQEASIQQLEVFGEVSQLWSWH